MIHFTLSSVSRLSHKQLNDLIFSDLQLFCNIIFIMSNRITTHCLSVCYILFIGVFLMILHVLSVYSYNIIRVQTFTNALALDRGITPALCGLQVNVSLPIAPLQYYILLTVQLHCTHRS